MNYLLIYDPICIPVEEREFRFLNPAEIIYIEGAGRYCNIYCINGRRFKNVSLTLKQLEPQLPKRLFYRVHKSYFVSKAYLDGINSRKTRLQCLENITVKIGVFLRAA